MAAYGSGFDALLAKNVPHILEKIFLSLDYKSFMTCKEVSKTWRELLTSEFFQLKEKSVYIMELRDYIKRAMDTSLATGDTWYLCDVLWFTQLKRYLGLPGLIGQIRDDQADFGDPTEKPGVIDLSWLFQANDPSGELKKNMVTDIDYIIMPESAWNKLVEIFGLTEGQHPVARKVIYCGMYVKHYKVEVYLTELKLAEMSNLKDVRRAKFSRCDTLSK